MREAEPRPSEAPSPARWAPWGLREAVTALSGATAEEWEALARALTELWARRPPAPVLQRYGEAIDITVPEGRWELLALALLLGAPVRRECAEAAFCELRRQGLLRLDAASGGAWKWCEAVDGVMARLYRGPVRRTVLRERLASAARTLRTRWGGDLDGVYEQARRHPDGTAALLREAFEGMDRMAAWLVREMGRLGAWPGAHRHPAAFFVDSFMREAAANLGMIARGPADRGTGPVGPPAVRRGDRRLRRAQEDRLRTLVERYFRWDGSVLSSHGREFCGARSAAVCLSRCPVSSYCKSWARRTEPDTGKEAGGRSTGS